jgi:prophage DNA circulation protein
MAWLDSYRAASFRGVAFYVESHDASFGRRQVTHEYPQRDQPFTEDLGRKARDYTVDAYLIGDDYPAQRDRLIAECEKAGSGELVHPYLGNIDVVCTGLKIRESLSDLRMCRVQISFVESGLARYPSNDADAVRAVTGAANGVVDAGRDSFIDRFTADGFPSFVTDGAAALSRGLAGVLGSLPVNPTGDTQDVAALFGRVTGLSENALSLVGSPGGLADEVIAVVTGLRGVFGSRADSVLRIVRAAYEADYAGGTATPSRVQFAANHNAFAALVRRVALAEETVFAVLAAEESATAIAEAQATGSPVPGGTPFVTREDAIAARDLLTEAIDAEAEREVTSDEEYVALSALRAQVVRGLPAPDLRLPRVASVTPPGTTPSLVVAYQLYENAGRAVEIAERNRARHPGFLTGGEPLEVITDA